LQASSTDQVENDVALVKPACDKGANKRLDSVSG